MNTKKLQHFIAISIFLMSILALKWIGLDNSMKPERVELVNKNGKFILKCNGKPFYVKGAGSGYYKMESLAKHGANSLRTWSVNEGEKSGKEILDKAHKLGLKVCMGIVVGNERWGFDYNDEEAVNKQFERIKKEVIELKNHPALLVWGIGNELNLNYKNKKVWDAVNNIAAMIHKIDPNHPTTTMLAAGALTKDINLVIKRCPEIDFLSFQIYGDILNLPKYINESDYRGAYIVSEWGPTGHWEVPKTSWNRPIEETSHEKAEIYMKRYKKVMLHDSKHCIGSFVFLWGQKQERTPTWYGLFLKSGEETEAIDVMHFLWKNEWPENRCPILQSLTIEGKNANDNVKLKKGHQYTANVKVIDPDGDMIKYKWSILPEVPREKQSEGGDFEQHTNEVLEYSNNEFREKFVFSAPNPGEYRLFVYASDGKGHAATANIPFLVINN